MKSLVIGASGQVGALLYRAARRDGACLGTYRNHAALGLTPLDLRDASAVASLIRDHQPDVCYLPAALTHVDRAESQREECRAINVDGVGHVALELARINATLVFFSTEHVFNERARPWRENEPPCPLSVYAASKVAAEELIREVLPKRHLIVRTSWVFGPDQQEKNFLFRVRGTLNAGELLHVPPGQWGQPTYGPDLARTSVRLVKRKARGTIHIVGPRAMTRLSWALMLAEEMGYSTQRVALDWSPPTVDRAPRPQHIRLSRSRLLRYLDEDPIRSPRQGIRATMRSLEKRKAINLPT
ncbi:MAG TPA: NAD(P)-dependent oxidoreductase [Gemmataceae bacterium]|jgi:dTDP-4-dehydrorhamnose reductase|nr:NAD(P)-dependent oxidoreductase [Gemmataceae bacterium]